MYLWATGVQWLFKNLSFTDTQYHAIRIRLEVMIRVVVNLTVHSISSGRFKGPRTYTGFQQLLQPKKRANRNGEHINTRLEMISHSLDRAS
jgi:hypothetical protein